MLDNYKRKNDEFKCSYSRHHNAEQVNKHTITDVILQVQQIIVRRRAKPELYFLI